VAKQQVSAGLIMAFQVMDYVMRELYSRGVVQEPGIEDVF
jgi:hypothetical protein